MSSWSAVTMAGTSKSVASQKSSNEYVLYATPK